MNIRNLFHLSWISLTFLCTNYFLANKFPGTDLLQYWSASKLFFSNQNPYELSLLENIQAPYPHLLVNLSNDKSNAISIMYNPPIVLPLIFYFKFVSFEIAKVFYYTLSILTLSLIFYFFDTRKLYDRILILALMFGFPFILTQLYWGQINLIILLTFLLYFIARKDFPVFSGVCLSFSLIKPHVLYLIYLYEFLIVIKTKDYRIVGGFILTTLGLAFFVTLYMPNIWSNYSELFQIKPPREYWVTASFASQLEKIYDFKNISYLNLFLSLIVFSVVIRKRQLNYSQQFPVVVALSLLFSPYYWIHDLCLLIIPLGYMINQRRFNYGEHIFLILLIAFSIFDGHLLRGLGGTMYYLAPIIFILIYRNYLRNNPRILVSY